ncbi:FtsX-like permease family protein [Clostridium sp. DL1XJH146]
MKVLSPRLYTRRNKKKVFASINSVMIAVAFLLILYSFVRTLMFFQLRKSVYVYNEVVKVMPYGEKPIDITMINNIINNENVDKVVPIRTNLGIKYVAPGVSDRITVLPILEEDREYLMEKLNITIVEGRLPKMDSMEIAITKDIAINREVKIGDKVGDSINKFDELPGEYEIVGLLENDALTSIVSVNESSFPNYSDRDAALSGGFYVFPEEGKKEAMDEYLTSLINADISIVTKKVAQEYFDDTSGVLKVIDIIAILSIVVMVLTVGSSKYAQYLNRREELGMLNALGYNKDQILIKSLKEVVLINLGGYVFGLILGVLGSLLLAKGLWAECGIDGFLYAKKGIIMSSFVPLFTILFSIIPINVMINKLDPIKMIEKN